MKARGRGRATTYEEKASGVKAAAGRQRENEIYIQGEAGWHQIHSSEL